MQPETYLNHPTFGLLFRVCLVEEKQELFATLYAQRLFFLVRSGVAEGLIFEPVGRSEARVLLENRLRILRRAGHYAEYDRLQKTYKKNVSMTASLSVDDISDRIDQVRQTIPPSIRLIAVTKQVSAEAARAAYMAGVRDFGESRIQEAIAKQAELADLTDITWHFIGHLQTNKAHQALTHFDWIHSIDSLKLARRLNHLAADLPHPPQCCLQVKIAPDPPKYGFNPAELWQALPTLDQCAALNIVGLMTIPPYGLNKADLQTIFQQARELADSINQHGLSHIQIQQLSMGMSADYPFAIAAGATMIRLGSVLFGQRPD